MEIWDAFAGPDCTNTVLCLLQNLLEHSLDKNLFISSEIPTYRLDGKKWRFCHFLIPGVYNFGEG